MANVEKMTPINVDELLADLDAILDRVEVGECFRITQDGRPTLVLIPYNAAWFDQAGTSPSSSASASTSTSTAEEPSP